MTTYAETRSELDGDGAPGHHKVLIQKEGCVVCPYTLHHWSSLIKDRSWCHENRFCNHCGAIEWWIPNSEVK